MRKIQKGITLLELMIVLVIAGLTMSAAVPAFQGMIARNRISTQTNDMLLAINLARSEAIRIGGQAYVAAVDSSDASNEFGLGWCVVLGTANCSSGEVIRTFEPVNDTDTFDSVENVAAMEFDSLGGLTNTSSNPRQFDLCSTSGADGRRVFVNLIGRAKSHSPDDLNVDRQPDC